MSTINPYDDLLPEERALLSGEAMPADTPADELAAASADEAQDEDAGQEQAAAPAEPAPEPATAAEPAEPAEAVEAAEPVKAEPEPEPVQQPAATQYQAGDPASFDAQRKALLTKKAEAMKQLMEGTLEAEAFAAVDEEVTAGLEQITVQRTLHEANTQAEAARQRQALDAIKTDAIKLGIDYQDPGLAALFDAKMRTLAASPEMAGKGAADLFKATHAAVVKLFGKDQPAPAPTPTTTQQPRPAAAPKPAIPPTLAQMPAAAPVAIGDDLMSTLQSMDDPDQAEQMMARMSVSQREAALRSTMSSNAARRRH